MLWDRSRILSVSPVSDRADLVRQRSLAPTPLHSVNKHNPAHLLSDNRHNQARHPLVSKHNSLANLRRLGKLLSKLLSPRRLVNRRHKRRRRTHSASPRHPLKPAPLALSQLPQRQLLANQVNPHLSAHSPRSLLLHNSHKQPIPSSRPQLLQPHPHHHPLAPRHRLKTTPPLFPKRLHSSNRHLQRKSPRQCVLMYRA